MLRKLSGLRYRQVDVFSENVLSGNGLAVFWNADGLSTGLMQHLTQELRQFESVFLTDAPSRFTRRARIFTMEEELDFAGHPVLGAAAVLHEQHGSREVETWTLALSSKEVQVQSKRRATGYQTVMNQGKPEFGIHLGIEESRPFWEALALSADDLVPGYPVEVVSTGLPYLIVPVISGLERARITCADFEPRLAAVGAKFVYVLDVERREARTWDNEGRVEDVATGSAAGPAGAYLWKHGGASETDLILGQGRFVGRSSQIGVRIETGSEGIESVYVSGGVSMVASGVFD